MPYYTIQPSGSGIALRWIYLHIYIARNHHLFSLGVRCKLQVSANQINDAQQIERSRLFFAPISPGIQFVRTNVVGVELFCAIVFTAIIIIAQQRCSALSTAERTTELVGCRVQQ